jgi:hypothetical protein
MWRPRRTDMSQTAFGDGSAKAFAGSPNFQLATEAAVANPPSPSEFLLWQSTPSPRLSLIQFSLAIADSISLFFEECLGKVQPLHYSCNRLSDQVSQQSPVVLVMSRNGQTLYSWYVIHRDHLCVYHPRCMLSFQTRFACSRRSITR